MPKRVRRLLATFVIALVVSLTGVPPVPVDFATPASAAAGGNYDPDGPQGTVYRLYRAYFLREPERAGYDYWVDTYLGGYPLTAISDDFAKSREFTSRYGNVDNRGFLDLVYRNVLGRTPDQGGYDYWLGHMSRGMPRGVVMINFSDSREFRSKTADGVPPGYMTVTRLDADAARIRGMWRSHSDAFLSSTEAGFRHMAANNYPGMGNSYEACRTWGWPWSYRGEWAPNGYSEEYVVRAGTVEPDPEWVIPDGPLAGRRPDGHIYVYTVDVRIFIPGWGTDTYASDIHATVLPDGSTKHFAVCFEN